MWYFTQAWLKWRYCHLPFKMKNWAETQKSDCIADIQEDINKITRKYINDQVRFNIKPKKDQVLNYYTNIFGERRKLSEPIFTQNEIASITSGSAWEVFLIILFIILEGFIFSQLLNFMIPREVRRQLWWISIPVGIVLSLLIVFAVKKALNFYFEYIEAKTIQKEENIPEERMLRFQINRNIAYVIFIAFLAFSVFAGFLRERVLLGAAADTNPFMGKMVFFMSLTLSIMVVLVLALVERDLHHKRLKYAVFKNWKRHEKERKEYITSLKQMYFDAQKAISEDLEKYWSLVLDLQRIFGCRYDDEDQATYKEFKNKMAGGEIGIVDDTIYYTYQSLQCADEALFKYGVLRDERLKEVLNQLKETKEKVEEFESTYKNKMYAEQAVLV